MNKKHITLFMVFLTFLIISLIYSVDIVSGKEFVSKTTEIWIGNSLNILSNYIYIQLYLVILVLSIYVVKKTYL